MEKSYRQIGQNAQLMLEQTKKHAVLEKDATEKSKQILVLENENKTLLNDINVLHLSKEVEINGLNKEVKFSNFLFNISTLFCTQVLSGFLCCH